MDPTTRICIHRCHEGTAMPLDIARLERRLLELQEAREAIQNPHFLDVYHASGEVEEEIEIVATLAAFNHRQAVEWRRSIVCTK